MRAVVPYARENRHIEIFFELYVVDVLGALPSTTSQAISDFGVRFPAAFGAVPDWRVGLKQVLNLSETIGIAILDLWYINRKKAVADGWIYHPWLYGMHFVSKYFEDGSKVDVWEGDALELAKGRIADEARLN
jgi:hypothetical protein